MGITGLLPFLEQASRTCHISEFRGATVAVDTYCWLHKGANSCAIQLARGEDTQIYVNYCMKYVRMLQHYNIRPILVFDGKNLPAKADTEAKRRDSRHKAKQRAAELLCLGKTEEARTYLKQSINVTAEMATEVIKECQKINVDCIVAPYESDAQLAFFNLKGIADIIITEDSDLVLFGCSKVVFKMDLQGSGSLVEADKIPQAMKLRPDKYTFDKFRYMCILSGCDYIDSLHGIGLKKALKFISLTDETNPEIFLTKLPRYLNMRHLEVTDEYREKFMVADATFRHQTVFDPFTKKLLPLTNPSVSGTNPKYCKNAGDIFDHEQAYQVALGNLHPKSFKRLNNWSPPETDSVDSSSSIWSGAYKKSISRTEQKHQFKKFFVTKKVMATIDEAEEEKIKIEEDIKITKELEFYSRKSEECQKVSPSETLAIPGSSKRESSPVLKRNPFIAKKKLSKFGFTKSDSQIVVKSRYFSGPEDVHEEVKIEEECIDMKSSEISDVENMPNNTITEIKFKKCEIEPKTSVEEVKSQKRRYVDLTMEEPSNDEGQMECIEEDTKKLRISSPHMTTNTISNVTKRKLGPCRSVGLKRSKSDGSGSQQSIQQFFEKLKKK